MHFLGFVEQVYDVLREATVYACTSRREGLGTAVVEALAVGLPVVATRCGGVEEVVTPDVGMLVGVGDGAAVAEAVAAILGTPERRARLSAAGPTRAAAFSVERMATGVQALYERLLQESTLRAV